MSVKVIDKRTIVSQNSDGTETTWLEFTINANTDILHYRIPADWDPAVAQATLDSYIRDLQKNTQSAEQKHKWMNEL